ncbi:MAG: SMP-30/gluconolactonase/LRE family protein [Acidobacteria bacterium]|nr:SMP-30/gluconolactonase/LRE family protein [Acidobacteriota bacterium]
MITTTRTPARLGLATLLGAALLAAQTPGPVEGGSFLPNGWRLKPAGRHAATDDYVLNLTATPDGKNIVALNCGYNPHSLMVVDPASLEIRQKTPLKSAWLGLVWSPDGKRLDVSGGNAESRVNPTAAPVYEFAFDGGRLADQPSREFKHRLPANRIYWSGLAHHPSKPLLYAANRGTQAAPGHVVVFDTRTGARVSEVATDIHPYDLVLDPAGDTLYVSNWGSRSVTAIDTNTLKTRAVLPVGNNPNDMVLGKDGRLYVACSNENSVYVLDTKALRPVEVISTAMYKMAPVGSTPNALALDAAGRTLFAANADNNNVAVIDVSEREASNVLGFIPTPWYPSSLAPSPDGKSLWVGSSKGLGGYANIMGPTSPLAEKGGPSRHIGALQRGSVGVVPLGDLKSALAGYTKQAMANCPYNDDMLARARPAASGPSVVPREVGPGSPIRHVIYIIKENRTYDQVFGDLPQGNGDARLCIFGRKVTPNQHKIAEEFVLLDNLYCDGEVSVDGHSWSNSAYATDFNEKRWPPQYGRISAPVNGPEDTPSSGHLWDLAARKGLTYRSYGEYAQRVSDGSQMDGRPGIAALFGHVSPKFRLPDMRDTDNVRVFIEEFGQYEKNYDSPDPARRLPNYVVMSLGENHTRGTTPGAHTPVAAVANNDWAVGQLVDRVTHSRYWPETAIFIIEDDAQNGPDHVDSRRTAGLVVSPYTRRRAVDSTLYTTSSMVRTIELLLGLPPMTQYDAAAMPMYASFTAKPDLTPFSHVPTQVDVNAKNTVLAWGARQSLAMDFSDYDRTPEFELNEIVWKSVRGAGSAMPLPRRSFHFRD